MSGLAIFRPSPQYDDLSQLAQEHFNHDLGEDDRAVLRSAGGRVSTHALLGSALGLGLGIFAAARLRRVRASAFAAFRAAEKPRQVVFADGRTGEFRRSPWPPIYIFYLTTFSRCSCLISCFLPR
jgi:hypothetical protein